MTREEAIKEIKSWDFLEGKELEAIGTLIPELKESAEDERIYKEIMEFFKMNEKMCSITNPYPKWIAWLEKQKENIEKEYVFRPLAGTDINSAALQAIRKVNEGDSLVLAFNGAYIPVRKGCNANKIVDIYDAFIEKQKEKEIPLMNGDADLYFDNWIQHNDTTKRGCFEEGIRYAQRLQKEQKPKNIITNDDSLQTAYLKGQTDVLEDPEAYGLQKASEWSKEDEEIRQSIIKDIKWERDNTPVTVYKDIRKYDEQINWLKSLYSHLKASDNWKPSEEQMDRLFSIVAALRKDYCDDMADFLANLYADLKKLGVKEEPEYYQHFDQDC